MEGEEVCFFVVVVFIDLESHKSFAYLPNKIGIKIK